MTRVIFDTNIYALLAAEREIEKIEPKITHSPLLTVYGCSVVRKELRQNPFKKTRNTLLQLYDHITKERTLEVSKRAEKLAREYYEESKLLGKEKSKSWDKNYEDFLIIAIASLEKLDIVFSDDKTTMFGRFSIMAYHTVNLKNNLRSPNFLSYSILKSSFCKV